MNEINKKIEVNASVRHFQANAPAPIRCAAIQFFPIREAFRQYGMAEPTLPKRATRHSMAYDFFSPADFTIYPGESMMIWTDVKAHMPAWVGLLVNVRSSMGRNNIGLANTQGWIDSDYADNPSNDGNIGICLVNNGGKPYSIKAGDRIAQGMFVPFLVADDDQADGERVGGFGSTNEKH